jgi:hypothetical protein
LSQGETPTQAYRELHPPRTPRETADQGLIRAEETLSNPAASTEERADAQRYIDATKAGRAITHPVKTPPTKEDRHVSSYTSAGGRHVDVFARPDGSTYERVGGPAHVGREGGAGEKPDTLFSKRAAAAEKKDTIQEQIAALNAQVGAGAWPPEAKARLAALQDKFKQASQVYEHWDGLYRQRTGGGAAPAGMVSVQIPGAPVGHIPRNQLARFKKDHPNAKVIE